jgi:hypothetical protein
MIRENFSQTETERRNIMREGRRPERRNGVHAGESKVGVLFRRGRETS